jgi:rhodanese-related sulfurtransferase
MVRASNVGLVLALLVLAAAGAAISNLAASTQRKLAWVGSYPRALQVEPAAPAPSSPPARVEKKEAPAEIAPSPPSPAAPAATSAATSPATGAGDLARSFPPHPDKPALEIAPADVQRLYEGKALFLDARRSSVYAEGHIAGARSFPVWESDIDRRVKGLYEEGLDQRAPVVVYCSGGACEDSHMLAEKLYMVGFDNVLIYKDGFPDWQKRALPTSKGANP